MTSTEQQPATYVYGIVPADVMTNRETRGVGDPPGQVSIVRVGDVAALVSEVVTDRPLGKPEDLTAHANILDTTAAEMPVLPMRFGAVLASRDAVAEELLREHHDEFVDALHELEGKAEYVVKGRYQQDAILEEVLAESEDAARLREAVATKPEDAARNDRIALGELIYNGLAAKRDADTRRVIAELESLGVEIAPLDPTHDEDAVHVACLANLSAQSDVESLVGRFADEWEGRVSMKLLGPLAPYEFVVTERQE